jgi:hypothetical protein
MNPAVWIATALLLVMIPPLYRAISRVGFGIAHSDDPGASEQVVLGIRGIIISIALGCIAAGLWLDIRWPIWFGIAFLAEELLETGIILWAIRRGPR